MNLEIFEDLAGQRINLLDLSNELQALGCEDIGYFGNLKDLLEDGNMVVATNADSSEHVQIFYNVIDVANGDEESILASTVEIVSIENF